MDEFERQLKLTRLREPSRELDRRVADAIQDALSIPHRRPFPLRWAAAAALAVGMIGFMAGRLSDRRGAGNDSTVQPQVVPETVVKFEIINEGRYGSPFDFTITSEDGLKPMTKVTIKNNTGV